MKHCSWGQFVQATAAVGGAQTCRSMFFVRISQLLEETALASCARLRLGDISATRAIISQP